MFAAAIPKALRGSDAPLKRLAVRARPLTNRLRRAVELEQDLAAVAVRTEVLQEAEVEAAPPLLCLPDDLERATAGVPGHTTLEEELARARQTEFTHDAVVRYELSDCLVHPSGFEADGASYLFDRPPPRAFLAPMKRLSRACYCNSAVSRQYFGHFVRDACTTAMLARDDEALLLDWPSSWANAPEYVEGLGLEPVRGPLFRVRRLSHFRDYGQGSLKRARYDQMRARLTRAFPGETSGASRVFFRRGQTGAQRRIRNEDAVLGVLTGLGFEVVDVGSARTPDLLRRFRGVEMVVSVDGSHLNHLYFSLPPGAGLLTLIPEDRFTMNQRAFAAGRGLRYGCATMKPGPGGYEVDPQRLEATLALFDVRRSQG